MAPLCRFLVPFCLFVLCAWGGYTLRTAWDSNPVVVDPNKLVNFDERRLYQRHISVFLESKFDKLTLGDSMFAYASLFGISRRNRMTPVLSTDDAITKSFKASANKVPTLRPGKNFAKFIEKTSDVYDRNTEYLNPDIDIELVGEFKSWKYFEFFHNEIKQEFTFVDDVSDKSHDFLENYVEFYKEQREHAKTPQLIGVYVERKGKMHIDSEETKAFLTRAMEAYRARYTGVLFIVASDDPEWATENLEAADVAFTEGSSPSLDLAVLSRCNHSIFTSGEVGWWAGWLAGGDVLYQDNVQPDNLRGNALYFPKTWKAM